ncbi:MAG TPA: DNA-binding protein [Methanosphaera sp.]|nr:DNA-binding protein [Methanosphaera sp.]
MSELDEIRRRRMEQLQQQQMAAQQQSANYQQLQQEEQMRQQYEQQKKNALRQILSPEARQRLANLRLTKAELVNAIEMQLIQMAETGRIQIPISDATLKQILRETTNTKREIHITRK